MLNRLYAISTIVLLLSAAIPVSTRATNDFEESSTEESVRQDDRGGQLVGTANNVLRSREFHLNLATDLPRESNCGMTSGRVFDTFFGPRSDHDNTLNVELSMIKRVIAARESHSGGSYPEGRNPFYIKGAVFNLSIPEIMNALMDAESKNVDVQLLIDYNKFDPSYFEDESGDIPDNVKQTLFKYVFKKKEYEVVDRVTELADSQRETADVIGIDRNKYYPAKDDRPAFTAHGAMHLKLRRFQWIDESGKTRKCIIVGSGNPVNTTLDNNEVMHVTNDEYLINRYEGKYEQLLNGGDYTAYPNEWNSSKALNVLFTNSGGLQIIEKIGELIDAENHFIAINMFIFHDIGYGKRTLADKLIRAHNRGVTVVVVSDRYFTDPDMSKPHARDNDIDDKLKAASIPFYEVDNITSEFNAMHLKVAIFGIGERMTIATGSANYSRGGLGYYRTSTDGRDGRDGRFQFTRNDEDVVFINSLALDNHKTGRKYLENLLYLVYAYNNQRGDQPSAGDIEKRLLNLPGWPLEPYFARANDGTQYQEQNFYFRTFFGPYDTTLEHEIELIDKVIDARKDDPTQYEEGENPFWVKYAVYNLRNQTIISKLIEAHNNGVDVQVIMPSKQLQWWYNKADDRFIVAGFDVPSDLQAALVNDTARDHSLVLPKSKIALDRNFTQHEQRRLDFIAVHKPDTWASSLSMHLKTRLFHWHDERGIAHRAVITGSMNPGDAAPANDETLHVTNHIHLFGRYHDEYKAILGNYSNSNQWQDSRAINVVFSTGKDQTDDYAGHLLLDHINQADGVILLSHLIIRNISVGGKGDLLAALQNAVNRGVKVIAITDRRSSDYVEKDGSLRLVRLPDGDGLKADHPFEQQLRDVGVIVYEAVNMAGQYNAMHHKYMVSSIENNGELQLRIITDTGNMTDLEFGATDRPTANDESFLIIDSKAWDNNATGYRYVSNFLYLLRKYEDQQTNRWDFSNFSASDQATANDVDWQALAVDPDARTAPTYDEIIQTLSTAKGWPRVGVSMKGYWHVKQGQRVSVVSGKDWARMSIPSSRPLALFPLGRFPSPDKQSQLLFLPAGLKLQYQIARHYPGSTDYTYQTEGPVTAIVDVGHLSGPAANRYTNRMGLDTSCYVPPSFHHFIPTYLS